MTSSFINLFDDGGFIPNHRTDHMDWNLTFTLEIDIIKQKRNYLTMILFFIKVVSYFHTISLLFVIIIKLFTF